MKTKIPSKGFTLIELIIYMGLFTVILSAAFGLFYQAQGVESQTVFNQDIDSNARAALLEMTQTIRSSQSVSVPTLGNTASELYLNTSTIRYFVDTNGILQKTVNGQTDAVTSPSVQIQNISFKTLGEVGFLPAVSISFTIASKSIVYGQTGPITKSYQTTVQLR